MDGRVLERVTGLCFRWAHQMSSFTDTLKECYQGEKFVDVHICCGGHSIPCHRSVLSSVSPFLKSLLQESASDTIMVIGIRFSILQRVIRFIYTGDLDIENDVMLEFIEAVKCLGIAIFDEENVLKSLLEAGLVNEMLEDNDIDLGQKSKLSLQHSKQQGPKSTFRSPSMHLLEKSLDSSVTPARDPPKNSLASSPDQDKTDLPNASSSKEKSTNLKEGSGLISAHNPKDGEKELSCNDSRRLRPNKIFLCPDCGNEVSSSIMLSVHKCKYSKNKDLDPEYKPTKKSQLDKKSDCIVLMEKLSDGLLEAARIADAPIEVPEKILDDVKTENCECSQGYTDNVSIDVHMLIHSYLNSCRSKEAPITEVVRPKKNLGKYSEELNYPKIKRPRVTKDLAGPEPGLSPKPGRNCSDHPGGSSVSKCSKISSRELDSLPPILRPNNESNDNQKLSANYEPGPETPPQLERMSSPQETDAAPGREATLSSATKKEQRFASKDDLPYAYDEYGRILRKQMKDQGILKEVNVALKDSVYEMFCILKD